ncbi:MAG: DEAD/DEAH box helicase [Candidatus Methanomethyliaceae archaeon]|nr:DEAD/DEAH box helicase [Candidatus Methanomethyliaceae archaeon]MDW7970796.1 DEAD/DEAH box helicase [Nitrososphaerota archaeon]
MLLSKPIQKLLEEKRFTKFTEPQEKAIPLILEGKNVLIIAPTGTGKTEAAFLPILDMLIREGRRGGISVLYITPLRALNRDLMDRLHWWCSRLDLKISVRHGDTETKERGRQALSPPDVLITTPETLQAILPGKRLRKHLSKVKWIIIDEVHELTNDKRGSQLSIALERIRKITEEEPQIIGLSATIGSPDEVSKFLVGVGRECEIVRVSIAKDMKLSVEMPDVKDIDLKLAEKIATFPEVAARLRLMKELIDENRSALIFTNTRSEAEVLASRFRVWDMNIPISIHHGSLSKSSRVEAESGLKRGELKGVVCTSSLELGIDIGTIDLVIQYNSPRQVTRLLQRVGRSGHWVGGTSKGVIVALDSDDALESIVIARRALREELERVEMVEKPLDVLVHQIAGLIIEYGRLKFNDIMELVKKAYPFRNLTEEELKSALEFMSNRRPRLALYIPEEDVVIKARPYDAVFKYYFENLSMIPEEKHYLVIDEEKDEAVGMLDEAFVAEYGEPGVKFIVRGSPWRILHIYKDTVYVKAENDPLGAIPDWVGDEIPVPFEIAQEVGAIRELVNRMIKSGRSHEEIIDILEKHYPAPRELLNKATAEIVEQAEGVWEVPTDKIITIECWEGYVIINCAFGLMINKALSRLLGYLISERTGSGVGASQDPYRVFLKTFINGREVAEILRNIDVEDLDNLIEISIEKTGLFKRRLLHVAKRFGIIAKDADLSEVSLQQLAENLKDTIIWREALKEISHKDLDIKGLKEVIRKIREGYFKIVVMNEELPLSPISRLGIRKLSWKTDLIPADRLRRIMIESGKARLLNEARVALCCDCLRYVENIRIKNFKMNCPNCGSMKIALLDADPKEVLQMASEVLDKKRPSEKFKRLYRNAMEIGELIATYGLPAVMAIAARNLSKTSILRIASANISDMDFLVDMILREERESLKSRYESY